MTSSPRSPCSTGSPLSGIDDLQEQVVLVHVQAAGALALAGHAGPHDLGEAVGVDGADAELLLERGLHRVGAGLAAEEARAEA